MNNIIEIRGASLNDVKKALKNWINLYSKNFSSKLTFRLYNNGTDNQIIIADELLDNEHFFYLVNYLEYPEGIEYNVEIKGLTKGKNIDKRLNGKDLLIYISKMDKEHDNVYVVTKENRHYKIDFGGKITEQTDMQAYKIIETNKLKNPITFTTNIKEKLQNSESKIGKRFRIVFYIAVIAVFIHFLIPSLTENERIVEKGTLFTGMGIALWFFMDFEMLRLNSFYIKSLFIGIGFFFYGFFFRNYYHVSISNLSNVSYLFPSTFLIIQYPTRQLYKLIFNREPEVDKHGKFADLIYTMILFFAFAILPFIILDFIK